MKWMMQAASVAFLVAITTGAAGSRQGTVEAAFVWGQLTADQREMIDLVARDIWENERTGSRGVSYRDLREQQKHDLRDEAMDRLGFERRPLRGVEA